MNNYLCEQCGAAVEGEPPACGAEVCHDCCEYCHAEGMVYECPYYQADDE